MPGINGIICKHKKGDEQEKLNTMLTMMLHESFYTYGTYINEKYGIFIGFSSLPHSFSDCMPIHNETEDVLLFLTGECYIDTTTVNDLKNREHVFDPENASFLVHLYEEQGNDFLINLNGWYNGFIVDLRQSKMILFNDRYGIRRIYYHEDNECFSFSSEAKSLLKAFPHLREISHRSVGEYLTYDCVFDYRTFFPQINLLPPSSLWTFQGGKVEKKTYFNPQSLEDQPKLSEKLFFEELSQTFVDILPRYLFGSPLSMSLTGGLDSRMIMACLNPEPGQIPCYTFGGQYRDTFDMRIAPRIAKACNQNHTIFRLEEQQYLRDYPNHVQKSIFITDGLERVDNADAMYFNKLAGNIAPIRITGIYGSQVLKSVSGLKERAPDYQLTASEFRKFLHTARTTYRNICYMHPLSAMLFYEIPLWWNGFIVSQSTQQTVRSPFLDYDFVKTLYRVPSNIRDFGTRFQLNLIKAQNPKLLTIPTNYGHMSSPSLMRYLYCFLNIADKIYIREEIPFHMTHIIGKLDHLQSPIHADKLIMGFADFRRYRVWFRDQLSDFLHDILTSKKTLERPYWNKKGLIKVVEKHTKGQGTYMREIRKALQIELIHRVLLEDI